MANANEKLDTVSHYSVATGINFTLLKERHKIFERYYRGKTCLELGTADGGGTQLILPFFDRVVGVDGSPEMIKRLQELITSPKLEAVCSYFEDLNFKEKFDTIMLSHILEHVDDPVAILQIAKKFSHKDTVIIADVPNALSIHRQIGVLMGMLPTEYTLNEGDISIGHQRVYDLEKFVADIRKAGLQVIDKGGVFLKPLSNAQMEKLFDENEKLIDAFAQWGQKHPEMSAEIYCVAVPRN